MTRTSNRRYAATYMSDGVKLWCFLLLIPFFLAVGHDVYVNYLSTPEQKTRLEAFEIDPKAYQSSDFGYILINYTPNYYENIRAVVGEPTWVKWVDPILRLYTFVVALVPALLFFIWLLISRIFDIWPFSGAIHANAPRSKRGDYQAPPRRQQQRASDAGRFKFKRR